MGINVAATLTDLQLVHVGPGGPPVLISRATGLPLETCRLVATDSRACRADIRHDDTGEAGRVKT
jgi:hypothetical protein